MYLAKGISWTRFHKVLKISLCYEFAWFSVRQTLNSCSLCYEFAWFSVRQTLNSCGYFMLLILIYNFLVLCVFRIIYLSLCIYRNLKEKKVLENRGGNQIKKRKGQSRNTDSLHHQTPDPPIKWNKITKKTLIYVFTSNEQYINYRYDESEWVSDCCLTPIHQFFSYIMARTS